MAMTPFFRKLVLLAHVTFSVGWLGAVVAYLALVIEGLASHDPQRAHAAHLAMELIGWLVIVPLSLAALLSGIVQSLGTRWGLLRHWWIIAKFLLTIVATVVLLRHMQDVSRAARAVSGTAWSAARFWPELIHAGGGLLVLVAIATLSVFKPWGLAPWVRRRTVPAGASLPPTTGAAVVAEPVLVTGGTRWRLIIGVHAMLFVLLFAILHLGGLHHHH